MLTLDFSCLQPCSMLKHSAGHEFNSPNNSSTLSALSPHLYISTSILVGLYSLLHKIPAPPPLPFQLQFDLIVYRVDWFLLLRDGLSSFAGFSACSSSSHCISGLQLWRYASKLKSCYVHSRSWENSTQFHVINLIYGKRYSNLNARDRLTVLPNRTNLRLTQIHLMLV